MISPFNEPAESRLLVIRHVAWEGPHRILDSFKGVEVLAVAPLEGEPLPGYDEVSGALVMGGPMNVDETDRHPALAAEREWLAAALDREMPVLGVCLGAQLLARALGAEVSRGEGAEIGFAPVDVLDSADPVVGALAPRTSVLHWHGDVFDLPDGAHRLASSAMTENQAFRFGNAWGLLFHPEADAALVDLWTSTPEMAAEAEAALGADGLAALPGQARDLESDLIERSTGGIRAFADLVRRVQ